MPTIDKLGLDVYRDYAMRITLTQETNNQLRINEASTIPGQLQMVDISARLSEFDLVLGLAHKSMPWAYFDPPKNWGGLRRNPFAFFRVCPSFGSLADQERIEQEIENIPCKTPEDEAQKEKIKACMKKMGWINYMINYVMGKVGQFLQG